MGVVPERDRLDGSPFAVLATHGPDGGLDLVPCCFAIDDTNGRDGVAPAYELVTAVDHKPKRTTRLARLVNIERDPRVSLLIDHRDADDWSKLWWHRAHGRARIVIDGADHRSAVAALATKYAQYDDVPPTGPIIRIAVERWAGWSP